MKHDLGRKLLEAGLVSEESLKRAREIEKGEGGSVSAALVKLGAVTEDHLLTFLSELYGTASVNLETTEVDPGVVRMIPSEVANKFQVLPITRLGRQLTVAMANPANFFAIDDIKFITGHEVRVLVATESQLKRAIDKYYESAGSMDDIMKTVEEDIEVVETGDEDSVDAGTAAAEQAPVVKFVNGLIS